MSSSRFRNLLGSKRKSDSAGNVLPSASAASIGSSSPALNGTSSLDLTSNSTNQTNTNPPAPTGPPPTPPQTAINLGAQNTTNTQTANTMNGQPPAYHQAQQAAQGRGSPMPPPINTSMQYGHPGQQPMYQQPAPPGYPSQGQQPYGYAQQPMAHGGGGHALYGRAEVEGSQRSKAQLIVGIDFVSLHTVSIADSR